MSPNSVVELFPKRQFDFSSLEVGSTQTFDVFENLDVSQFMCATVELRVHDSDVSGGSIAFDLYGDGRTNEEPALNLLTNGPLFASTPIASSGVSFLAYAGRVPGALARLRVQATKTSSNPLRATVSARIVLSASAALDPLSILGALAVWVRADQGITVATGVSAWNDLSGKGVNFSQATAANQPAFIASAINGQPAVRGDGINDMMTASLTQAAPGTQPFFVWCVMRQISWTSNDSAFGQGNAGTGWMLRNRIASPEWDMFNTTHVNGNTAGLVGSYFRHEMLFTNSTSDYLKIGATQTSGANAGNLAGDGTLGLFACPGLAAANIEIAEFFIFFGVPTVQNRADLDAYCTGRYGAGLV